MPQRGTETNAGHFRIKNTAGTVVHCQGDITATGGGGAMTLYNVSIASGQTVNREHLHAHWTGTPNQVFTTTRGAFRTVDVARVGLRLCSLKRRRGWGRRGDGQPGHGWWTRGTHARA